MWKCRAHGQPCTETRVCVEPLLPGREVMGSAPESIQLNVAVPGVGAFSGSSCSGMVGGRHLCSTPTVSGLMPIWNLGSWREKEHEVLLNINCVSVCSSSFLPITSFPLQDNLERQELSPLLTGEKQIHR